MRVVYNLCIIHHFRKVSVGSQTNGSVQRERNVFRCHGRTIMEFYILFQRKVYAHTIFSDLPAFCQQRLQNGTIGRRFSNQSLVDLSDNHTEVRVRRSNAAGLQAGGFYNRDKGDGVFVGAFTICYSYSTHFFQGVIHCNVTGRRSSFAAFFRSFICCSFICCSFICCGFFRGGSGATFCGGLFGGAGATTEEEQAAHNNAKPYCPFSFHFFSSLIKAFAFPYDSGSLWHPIAIGESRSQLMLHTGLDSFQKLRGKQVSFRRPRPIPRRGSCVPSLFVRVLAESTSAKRERELFTTGYVV